VKTREAIAGLWGGIARTAQLAALVLAVFARVAEGAARTMQALAARARSRATRLPPGAELAGRAWLESPDLPLAAPSTPPPLPADARQNKADEDRQWQDLIEQARSQTPEPAEDWGAVIQAAKQRTTDRPLPRLPRPRPSPGGRSPQKSVAQRRP
jgi:hypothetical protein